MGIIETECYQAAFFGIFYICFLVFFIIGGSSYQQTKFIGKAHRRLIKIIQFPIIRMLPKVIFLFSYFYAFMAFKNIFSLYHYSQFSHFNLVYYGFYGTFALSAVFYFVLVITYPEETEEKDPENYCEEEDKYYKDFDHYSYFLRGSITKKNKKNFIRFIILTTAYSFLFLMSSLKYLNKKLDMKHKEFKWSQNPYKNGISLFTKLIKVNPNVAIFSIVYTTILIWCMNTLLDEAIIFLSGKTRYKLIQKLEEISKEHEKQQPKKEIDIKREKREMKKLEKKKTVNTTKRNIKPK